MAADARGQPSIAWDVGPRFNVTGQVLVGLVQAPASEMERRPDHRRQIDVEIHGRNPEERADSALSTVAALLSAIDALRASAEALAPKGWHVQYRNSSSYASLFLEGFEFQDDGTIRVLFDYGDLDLLILDLHRDGGSSVTIEP